VICIEPTAITQVPTSTMFPRNAQKTQSFISLSPGVLASISTLPSFSVPEESREPVSSARPSKPLPEISYLNLGGGATADTTITSVVFMALLIGAWYLWRRERRSHNSGG